MAKTIVSPAMQFPIDFNRLKPGIQKEEELDLQRMMKKSLKKGLTLHIRPITAEEDCLIANLKQKVEQLEPP